MTLLHILQKKKTGCEFELQIALMAALCPTCQSMTCRRDARARVLYS